MFVIKQQLLLDKAFKPFFGLSRFSEKLCMHIALIQWFPKWAVKQKWVIGGWWSRNGRLGGDRRPS